MLVYIGRSFFEAADLDEGMPGLEFPARPICHRLRATLSILLVLLITAAGVHARETISTPAGAAPGAVVITAASTASAAPSARQDMAALKSVAEQLLIEQAASLPGKASVRVSDPDARLQLPACASLQAWLPPGAKALGKTTVGIRCATPAWQLMLPATVSIATRYVASATPLAQGQSLGAADLMLRDGDLASLPPGVLTDLAQANGRTLQMPVAAGMPLSRQMLKTRPVVQPGQQVRLVAVGAGFSISGEGRALTGGAEGDLVQARTTGGQVVMGIAQADGALAIRY